MDKHKVAILVNYSKGGDVDGIKTNGFMRKRFRGVCVIDGGRLAEESKVKICRWRPHTSVPKSSNENQIDSSAQDG